MQTISILTRRPCQTFFISEIFRRPAFEAARRAPKAVSAPGHAIEARLLPQCFGHGQRINFDAVPPFCLCAVPVQFRYGPRSRLNEIEADRDYHLSLPTRRRSQFSRTSTSKVEAK